MDSVVVKVVQVESLFEVVAVEWLMESDKQVAVVEMEVMVQYLHLCMKKGGDVEKVLTVAVMERKTGAVEKVLSGAVMELVVAKQ